MDRHSPPIRCAPGTDLVLLIAYMSPYSLEMNISSSFFLHFWPEASRKIKISSGQLAPCQEKRIYRQQTVRSAGCKVLAPTAGFLLASLPSYCRFKPMECSFSESVSVSTPRTRFGDQQYLGHTAGGVVCPNYFGPRTAVPRKIPYFNCCKIQCVLVTRDSSAREYGSRVFYSSPCGPLLFILC